MTGLLLIICLAANGQVGVYTQNNDNQRTGQYSSENILTPTNVNVSTFGKLFTIGLDAQVNGQVLYVPNAGFGDRKHNAIIAYTSNNSNGSPCSLWCFDADNTTGEKLWQHQFTNSAEWTTCTPVVDPVAGIVYVLTKTNDDSGPNQLHAISLGTGSELTGSPVTLAASVSGTGDGNVSGVVTFDTSQQNCRPGLLLVNGVVYLGFAHNSDSYPYHGWIFGYKYSGSGFTQTAFFCTNPNGGLDGVWMAGKGLVADANNNIYFVTGNGTFDVNTGGTSYGMSIVRLTTPELAVADYFTPWDESGNSDSDLDFGGDGILEIAGTETMWTGGSKFGSGFLVDKNDLGGFTSGGPDKVLDRVDNITSQSNVGQNPVSWDAGSSKYVYNWPGGQRLEEFKYDPLIGALNPDAIYKTSSNLTAGGSLAVSSNGSTNGILWCLDNNAVLHAVSATDITQADYWNSGMNPSRDGFNSVGHFQFPTVANGKVYVPDGSGNIIVYGLLADTNSAQVPHIAVTKALTPAYPAQCSTFTVSVTGSGSTPTGSVTIKDGTKSVATIPLASGSGAACVALDSTGTHSLSLDYAGNYNATTVNYPQTVDATEGHGQLLMQSTSTRIARWYFDNGIYTGSDEFANLPGPGMDAVGTGDFDGNGSPDILFQNQSSGQLSVWYLNRSTFMSSAKIAANVPTGWRVVGVGDFNGDGKPDILLYNSKTRQLEIWFMNGITLSSVSVLPNHVASTWNVIGVGDFNEDGYSDILFQNPTYHLLAVWYMNGAARLSVANFGEAVPAGWTVSAVTDLYQHSSPDLVLTDGTSAPMLWRFDDVQYVSKANLSPAIPSGWNIVGPK